MLWNDKKRKPDKPPSRKHKKQEKLAYLWYFENMDRVNRAMQGTNDLEQVMKDVLDTLLFAFECDRAWLVYPCDPEAATWQVPMERTTPEYPSVIPIGVELPLDPVGAEVYRILRNASGPVKFGPRAKHPVPTVIAEEFQVQSFIAMAFYPKIGKPWSFGLHQCSYARDWIEAEERLFQEIGRRLSDTLTSLLAYRNLQESEKQIKQLIDASPVAMVISFGSDERVESVNNKFIELFGYTVEDMPDVAHWWPLAYPDEKYREEIKTQWKAKVEQAIREKGQIEPMETVVTCKDGSRRYVEFRFSSMGERHLVTFVDLTGRKQADEELRQYAERLERAERQASLGSWEFDVMLGKGWWSKQMYRLLFFDELKGVPDNEEYLEHIHPEDRHLIQDVLINMSQGKEPTPREFRSNPDFGPMRYFAPTFYVERDSQDLPVKFIGTLQDITERKRAEEELQSTNDLLRAIIEAAPTAIIGLDVEGKVQNVWNPAAEKMLGWSAQEAMGKYLPSIPMDKEEEFQKFRKWISSGEVLDGVEVQRRRRDGTPIDYSIYASPLHDAQGQITGNIAVLVDITERKRAEDALRESEEHYRQLVNLSPDSIVVYSRGRIVFANLTTVQMTGAKSEEDLIGRSVLDFIHPDFRATIQNRLDEVQLTAGPIPFVEETFLRLDGSTIDVEVAIVPYSSEGEENILIVARNITERKRHELEREAIITVSTALRQATTRTDILNMILDQLIDLFRADGTVLVLPDLQSGGFIDEMGRGAVGERMVGLNIPPGIGVSSWVIENKKAYLNNHADHDPLFYRPDLLGDSHCLAAVPLIAHEQAIGALWIARQIDITQQELRLLNAIADIAANAIHRIMLHEQTVQQLHHLLALHQIDLAISANFDLNITLKILLKNVKHELEVDAASILLMDPVTHTLDYAAGTGFRTRNIEGSHVKLGHGYAGRAAQERRTISGPDLNREPETFSRLSLLADEGFVSHYATPLVVKGQVKGVLETFHRKSVESKQEWIDYFETLATQAAIAIESAFLFENLQRSNMELVLAYDATIEGWSRALDLRDRETEGHTQRVAERMLNLAEKMGMSDAEKTDLRRGALLHDIGKMGVPDSILLKPGTLSESEREVMRQHPFYAFQMLSPILYLKRALEIPYCHHEKWDGSGYPRGLRGEEIPLFARMFAVVDVFDALTSDRPYRAAWTHEKAYRYIQREAGRHFDPQIVKIFLEGI